MLNPRRCHFLCRRAELELRRLREEEERKRIEEEERRRVDQIETDRRLAVSGGGKEGGREGGWGD